MSQDRCLYLYDIEAIPDCTHHSLVALCGGSVREYIFKAHEHVLRMLSNFKEGQIGFSICYNYDPDSQGGIQSRLRLQLAVRTSGNVSQDTVRQLIDSGPLSEFYHPVFVEGTDRYSLPFDFPYVCEIVRREQKVKPLIAREENPGRIPSIYYSIEAFEAIEDNDCLMLDALLSRMPFPCTLEMTVCPVNQDSDLEAHYKYIKRLMSVNEYSDVTSGSLPYNPFFEDEVDDESAVLTLERKKDPMADDIAREHQEFHQLLRKPQLLFNLKAYAMNSENALMLASTLAEAGISEGKYNLISYAANDVSDKQSSWYNSTLKASQSVEVSLVALFSELWDDDLPKGYQAMSRLSHMASVDELKGLFRLPVAGRSSPRCLRKMTDPVNSGHIKGLLLGDDLESQDAGLRDYQPSIGDLSGLFVKKKPSNLELKLPLVSMPKHMFVSGVPGSGKTTAVFNMLVQLYRHDIPFLVIEPAKTEYRLLKTLRNHPDASVRDMAENLRVYTPGNDSISPFRYNPFSYPQGVTLDEHMSQLSCCFEAAMPMMAPLPALIAEAMEVVYDQAEEGCFPRMSDMVHAIETVLVDKPYEGEIKSNIQAMIQVRFGLLTRRAMGKLFECDHSIPSVQELLDYPTVIEMDHLSQDHACLLTLFLLSAVREHVKIDPARRKRGLHHVTVVEEAHNIVGKYGQAKASENTPDPKAFAANYISRMLAEMRALGECMIIADQLPSAVAAEVVKNTGTKLAHRLVSNDDREDLGGAMLLDKNQAEEIARLKPGEAYYYTEGLHLPRRIRCLNANDYLQLTDFIDAGELLSLIATDNWFLDGCIRRTGLRKTITNLIDMAREAAIQGREKLENRIDAESCCNRVQNEITRLAEIMKKLDCQIKTVETYTVRHPDELSSACRQLLDRWHQQVRPQLIELTKNLYSPLGTV